MTLKLGDGTVYDISDMVLTMCTCNISTTCLDVDIIRALGPLTMTPLTFVVGRDDLALETFVLVREFPSVKWVISDRAWRDLPPYATPVQDEIANAMLGMGYSQSDVNYTIAVHKRLLEKRGKV